MENKTCSHGADAPVVEMKNLPHNQAEPGRHKCAICAYFIGKSLVYEGKSKEMLKCQHGLKIPAEVANILSDSQTGPGVERHKCVACAYQKGRMHGLSELPPEGIIIVESGGSPASGGMTQKILEGRSDSAIVNVYERDRSAREKCIAVHGTRCLVCCLDFASTYGEIGAGFIHVHHLTPIAQAARNANGNGYELDPVADLRPVCPNCHAMVHKKKVGVYTLEKIRQFMQDAKTAIKTAAPTKPTESD